MPSASLPRSTQVLVVGGGPAGSATAWYCAQAGLDVLLVDRARFPRAKPCAEYVSPEGARILSAMGALPAVERQAADLTGMLVHAPSGAQIHGEFVALHGFRGFRDRGLGIRREVLDALLLDCARAAGVQVLEHVKVNDVVRDAHGRATAVRVARVGGTPTAERDLSGHDIPAQLIVGADGLRSVVARRMGLAHSQRWPRRIALVAHYHAVDGVGSLGEMFVTHDGYLGLADVGDGLTNVALVVPMTSARDINGDRGAFLDRWLSRHPTLASRFRRATRVSPVRATGPFASRARRPFGPSVALVGDAADFFDPFTGEGIFAALRGGELLAPFVVGAVAAQDDGARVQRALHAYQQARHAAFIGKWRVERLIGTAVAFPSLMNVAARVLGRDRELADLLIGVTGDFVPASAMLAPRTLGRVVGAFWHALSPFAPSDPHHAAAAAPQPPFPTHVHRS